MYKRQGLEGFIRNDLSSKISFTDKFSLDISYKKWKFTDMFLFFIERRKATTLSLIHILIGQQLGTLGIQLDFLVVTDIHFREIILIEIIALQYLSLIHI